MKPKLPGTDAIKVGKGGDSPLGRMIGHPDHYQALLAEVIRRERPSIMIETGVESGYSSEHFLKAMDDNRSGHLFSCDPAPSGFYVAYPIVHPRFTFIKEASYTALDKIFSQTGRVDFFVHDSDHSYACQTWEYEWAWKHVSCDGIIASDDVGWSDMPDGQPKTPHHAWDNFLQRHGLTGKDVTINSARWVRKL